MEMLLNPGNILVLILVFIHAAEGACPISNPCVCTVNTAGEQIIDCSAQGLTAIPAITNSPTLYAELNLKGNLITSISDEAFSGLRIKRLNFGEESTSSTLHNQLSSVSSGAFSGLENDLVELYLTGDKTNGFATPYNAIQRLTNLEKLSLTYFRQTTLSSSNFSPFQKLKFLKLAYFNVNSIGGTTFSNNNLLQTLEITNSKLTSLPLAALQTLRNVQTLSFATGEITQLTAYAFNVMTNLTELDVSYNSIDTVEANTFNTVDNSLKILNLKSNSLNDDQVSQIGNMSLLEELDLSYNNLITNIPVISLPSLTYLSLNNNNVGSLHTSTTYTSLEELHLSNCNIRQTDANDFLKFPSLKKLYLTQQTGATLVIESFNGVENSLEFLDLSQNRNSDTPRINEQTTWAAIGTLTKLKKLVFNDANLQAIPDFQFSNMQQLSEISLMDNRLAIINQKMFHGLRDSLTYVDFHGNMIATIDHCVFKDFTKLKYRQLNQNPLHCDCLLKWLYQWYRDQEIHDPDFSIKNMWTCNSPSNLKDEFFSNVPEDDIRNCPANVTQPICVNYYTTPTTTTPTTTTPPIPLPTITGSIKFLSSSYIIIQWVVSDKTYISGFTINYKQLPSGTPSTINISSADTTEKKVEDLLQDEEYEFCITVEINQPINEPQPRFCFQARTVVIPSLTLRLVSGTPTSFTIGWTATSLQHIKSFDVEYTDNTTNNTKRISNIQTDLSSKLIDSLESNTDYKICIVAALADNIEAIAPINCMTEKTPIQLPTITGRADALSSHYVIVKWTISDKSYVSGFTISYKQLPSGATSKIDISSADVSERKVDNLLEDKKYEFCLIVKINQPINEAEPRFCFQATTVVIPTIRISQISDNPNAFEIAWTVSDFQYVKTYSVEYTDLTTNNRETSNNIPNDKYRLVLTNLKPNTLYEVCVIAVLKDNIQSPVPTKCLTQKTAASTATTSGQSGGDDEQQQSWVIIVAIVAAVVFVALLMLIVFFLIRYKRINDKEKLLLRSSPAHVQPRSFTTTGTPRLGYDSKRFAKPKKATQNDDITVKVISTGKMDGTRMSAGSYQFLDESQPKPSTSSNYSSDYVNNQGVRPLPHRPKSDEPPNYYDSINDGVDNSAFETSPVGSPTNGPGFINEGFETSPSRSSAAAPPRTSSRPASDNFETPI